VSFVDPAYPAFVTAVLALYALLGRRGRNLLLVAASALFYGWVHPWWVGLLAFSVVLDYGCGLGMVRRPEHRKAFLACSVVGNVTLLGVFNLGDLLPHAVVHGEGLVVAADVDLDRRGLGGGQRGQLLRPSAAARCQRVTTRSL